MAMMFCQLARADSLREICGGLACCEGQLKHLGVPVAPKKSTLTTFRRKIRFPGRTRVAGVRVGDLKKRKALSERSPGARETYRFQAVWRKGLQDAADDPAGAGGLAMKRQMLIRLSAMTPKPTHRLKLNPWLPL